MFMHDWAECYCNMLRQAFACIRTETGVFMHDWAEGHCNMLRHAFVLNIRRYKPEVTCSCMTGLKVVVICWNMLLSIILEPEVTCSCMTWMAGPRMTCLCMTSITGSHMASSRNILLTTLICHVKTCYDIVPIKFISTHVTHCHIWPWVCVLLHTLVSPLVV